jgi:para-aminobenzoate synthetase component 1
LHSDWVEEKTMGLSEKTISEPDFDQFCAKMDAFGASKTPFVFLVDYKCRRPRIWKIEEVPEGVYYDFGGFRNVEPERGGGDETPVFHKHPVAFEKYDHAFTVAQKNIRRGESFLVNISLPTPIETNWSLMQVFQRSTAKYRFCFHDEFVCFSPEPFVRIHQEEIATYPMKGTIDAAIPDAEVSVLSNPKEAAEHATIVDLLRNDLSRVSEKVWVEKYRYIDTIYTNGKTLLQVSSEIKGNLAPRYRSAFGRVLSEMLPAGSITGAPKPKTLEIIEEAEGYDRGYYTGVMGYFDGDHFESAVMIRFIERTSGGLVFKSGGGITGMSDARSEYQEMIDKVYLPIPASSVEC